MIDALTVGALSVAVTFALILLGFQFVNHGDRTDAGGLGGQYHRQQSVGGERRRIHEVGTMAGTRISGKVAIITGGAGASAPPQYAGSRTTARASVSPTSTRPGAERWQTSLAMRRCS